jgi:hypothetical protein
MFLFLLDSLTQSIIRVTLTQLVSLSSKSPNFITAGIEGTKGSPGLHDSFCAFENNGTPACALPTQRAGRI